VADPPALFLWKSELLQDSEFDSTPELRIGGFLC
jgi:hypothetical protein